MEDQAPACLATICTCDCGWFGPREDCRRGMCPNCGGRDRREKDDKAD